MIVYFDPLPPHGHSVHFVPDEDAIAISKQAAKGFGRVQSSDEVALQDFMVTHWADTLDQTVEKMAKAMWQQHNHYDSAKINTARMWENGDRDGWREQAKAALRALGVTT